jgi:heme-degrading monooxygenase HmoA
VNPEIAAGKHREPAASRSPNSGYRLRSICLVPLCRRGNEEVDGASPFQQEITMYIAMNRFKVIKGAESAFEQVWLSRDTHLDRVPGFLEFHLLRGPDRDDHMLYSSHTVWASKAAFTAWTQSEHFRAAHRDAGANKPLYLGHPEFEGFEVIQTIKNPNARDQAA